MSINGQINASNLSKNYGSKATIAQILATAVQSLLLIGLGMELSMPTIVIKDLYENPNSNFTLSLSQVSWYGSILFIFHPTGSFISGFLQEKFGRKYCMIFANIPSILGWITLHFTNSTILLYTTSVLMGLSIGFSEAPILSYVGEITEPRLRGSMTSLASAAVMFGSLIIFILGFLFEWRTVALLSALCPIASMFLITLIPESPIWLVSVGKNKKAEKSLCWLRGWVEPKKIQTEYLELIHYNEVSGINNDSKSASFFKKLAELKNPSVYGPLKLVMIIFFISNIICLSPGRSFINEIFHKVGILNNHSLILVIMAVLQNIGYLIIIFTIHHVGKRCLAIFAFSINTVLLLLFGGYVIVLKNGFISSTPLIPTIIICCIYFFGAGVGSLPWMLISEVFPNKSRGIATGSCAGMSYLLMFVLTKIYLSVESTLTIEYTLILFGAIGIFGIVYLYFYLPETENKTLLEIEEYFLKL